MSTGARDAEGVKGAGNGEGVSPSPVNTRESGERRELPQLGPGRAANGFLVNF